MKTKEAVKVEKKKEGSIWRVIGSYIFIWPSIRKYTTYIKCYFKGSKDKDKYDYWK